MRLLLIEDDVQIAESLGRALRRAGDVVDVYGTAGAQFKAIQKSFTTTAGASGQIVLNFTASVDQAKCSGIAVN